MLLSLIVAALIGAVRTMDAFTELNVDAVQEIQPNQSIESFLAQEMGELDYEVKKVSSHIDGEPVYLVTIQDGHYLWDDEMIVYPGEKIYKEGVSWNVYPFKNMSIAERGFYHAQNAQK